MKKIVFLTISIATFGCNAYRHTVKSDEATAGHTVTVTAGTATADTAEHILTATRIGHNEDVVTETTVFDTSLPVDSATGTPPVKIRTVQRRRIATQAAQDLSEGRQTSATHVTDSITDERSESRTIAETSRKGLNPLQRALCLIGATAALFGIVRILKKFM